jgi:uncharacterized protein (TIGR02217 family)
MTTPFHEVRFPLDIARGSRGGPERRTDVVRLASGREERNSRWAHARRSYNAGTGIKSMAALSAVIAFFEERRGKLYGFRWRDPLDHSSAAFGQNVTPLDQVIAIGDGITRSFQLSKTYGSTHAPYVRPITKPVAGTVRVAVAGTEKTMPSEVSIDAATGLMTFAAGHTPASGASITAGFMFDVPVRFDTDTLNVDLSAFTAGEIPSIPLIEILP